MEQVTNWRKTRRSNTNGGACILVGNTRRDVAVKDSKDPDGPKMTISPDKWRAFVGALK